MDIAKKLFDKNLISKIKVFSKKNKILIWSERSKYKIILPRKIDNKIAYLSGAIIGDGNIPLTKRKISNYPRLRIRIFNSSIQYHTTKEY